jgi:transcriptional regulator with XRE-family HTH domain
MPLDIRIRFGSAIRRIREEQEINQEEAAERCGLHRTYYSGIERGVRYISLAGAPCLYFETSETASGP